MIIPVFDVKDGMCVSGKSGFRDTYTRLDSVYGDDIFEMSLGLRDAGARVVYIADLDRIMGVGDNSGLISEVNRVVPVLLDNGASCVDDIIFNKNICTYPILATETMNSISDVEQIFEEMPHDNIVISVDIKDNELLIKNKCIKLDDIIRLINKVKPAYTILLNLSQVGTEEGNTNNIIEDIIEKTPYTQHIIAGGITNQSITSYKKKGIDNFIIGTILHEGRLSKEHTW
ncbi:MAG: HisA/HisF family protein [Methanosphaera sp.]|nr:HisA/HisF family protein [Methanosphaera sp.]